MEWGAGVCGRREGRCSKGWGGMGRAWRRVAEVSVRWSDGRRGGPPGHIGGCCSSTATATGPPCWYASYLLHLCDVKLQTSATAQVSRSKAPAGLTFGQGSLCAEAACCLELLAPERTSTATAAGAEARA